MGRSASNVIYDDDSWSSDDFQLLQGSFSHVFPVIEASRNVTYRYVIKPLKYGPIRDIPSRVRYQTSKEDMVTVYSTSYRSLYILSHTDYIIHVAPHWVSMMIFFTTRKSSSSVHPSNC